MSEQRLEESGIQSGIGCPLTNCIKCINSNLIDQLITITLEPSELKIPTWSHNLTKYHPRFQPLCSPNYTGWNPTTSEHIFHLLSFTSIWCAVIPRNEPFMFSTVHPSAVDEIFPLTLQLPLQGNELPKHIQSELCNYNKNSLKKSLCSQITLY